MINENESCAKIIGQSDLGVQVCSAAARISTTEGTAFSVFNKSQESNEVNVKLIGKVLNSGHKTIIEHHCFNLAFNNVSVIVEQFLIELSKKHKLFIVSNCLEGYIEIFLKKYRFEKYFIETANAASGITKAQNIKNLVEKHNLKTPIYVGDTMAKCTGFVMARNNKHNLL